MTSPVTVTHSAAETEAYGAALAARLHAGDVVLLEGDLAAGKTTLVRGLVAGLDGEADEVSSPTFVLLQTYACHAGAIRRVHHVDLYRLEGEATTLREVGLEEVLSDPAAVVCVEWPRGPLVSWLPGDARLWRLRLVIAEGGVRRVELDEPGADRRS